MIFLSRLFFELIGFISFFSLVLVLAVVFPRALRGDFSVISDFFEAYRGIEPFVIFIFPVLLMGASAWIWNWVCCLRRRVHGSRARGGV